MKVVADRFNLYFLAISYLVALSGLFALYFSGGVGVLVLTAFLVLSVLAWFLEGTRWQLSERLGVVLIVLVIPLFFLDWKYKLTGFGSGELLAAGTLARLILFLSAVKLLQKKSDRDWIFIYVISFFEILLAAGLSISPLYLVSLGSYLLFTTCAIIAFEVRKTSREVREARNLNLKKEEPPAESVSRLKIRRLPLVAAALLLVTTLFAVPLFFSLPRVGGAGIGSDLASSTKVTGFSDSVTLGDIGRLQQNDRIVMRVRIDRNDNPRLNRFLWRGVALDTFDNRRWSKSRPRYKEPHLKLNRGYFLLDPPPAEAQMTVQTVYLEPLNTDVIFALSKPLSLNGGFQVVQRDAEGALSGIRNGFERISYSVFSDTRMPEVSDLREDELPYDAVSARYLQLPEIVDGRIPALAERIVREAGAANRYDRAAAIESYLQNEFGYTLELKAGGSEPLADFLFNVREGHCEYFATAMAVMLRTQGIATRVVNGFQQGDYNETADVWVIRQRNAHSWVEVYFPETGAWVPFDPTPFAGRALGASDGTFFGNINSYLEALETFWIQYFVAYDNQEQQSLFRSVREGASDYRTTAMIWAASLQEELRKWWEQVRGDRGLQASLFAIAWGAGLLVVLVLLVWLSVRLFRRIRRLAIWNRFGAWLKRRNRETRIVEFYERMQKVLASKGYRREPHQTPLEFAFALEMPEAVRITEKYNGVRFGEKNLTEQESKEIDEWLDDLEAKQKT